MKDLKVVTLFTMKEMLKRKSFVVTTIIILLLIILGFNIPNIINFFNKDGAQSGDNTELLIVDSNNVFEGTLESLNSMNLGYNIKVSNENLTFDDVKEKINNDEIGEAIIIEKSAEAPSNSDDLNTNPELSEASESDVDVSINSLDTNLNGQNAYKLRYIVKNMATISAMPEDLLNAISTVYTNLQISKLGLTQEQLVSLTANFE